MTEIQIAVPFKGHALIYFPDYKISKYCNYPIRKCNLQLLRWEIPNKEKHLLYMKDLTSQGYAVGIFTESMVGTSICDTRCLEAEKPKCKCSCGGANHRNGSLPEARLVGSTTLLVPGDFVWTYRYFEPYWKMNKGGNKNGREV